MKAKIIDMQDLECMDIVIKITGEVQSSDLAEFETAALEVIDNINLELNTDKDFDDAKKNVKSCKAIAVRIHNDRENALKSTESIDNLISVSKRLEKKFDDTRLILEKAIKAENQRNKKEIVDAGIKELKRMISGSPVEHGFSVADSEVRGAIRNKRSYDKMREAVKDVVESETERMNVVEELFEYNKHYLEKSEKEYPGLYPDFKQLALKPTNEVELTITAREEKFKNDKREADERKKKALVAKVLADEARERINKKMEVVEEKNPVLVEESFLPENTFIPPPPPLADLPFESVETQPDEISDYILTVKIHGRKIDALAIAEKVDRAMAGFTCVVGVDISKVRRGSPSDAFAASGENLPF